MLETAAEQGLVTGFWSVMTKTGADFNNTFRDLSGISKQVDMTDQDNIVLEKILSHCAPKEHLLSKAKNPYADNPRLLQILEV